MCPNTHCVLVLFFPDTKHYYFCKLGFWIASNLILLKVGHIPVSYVNKVEHMNDLWSMTMVDKQQGRYSFMKRLGQKNSGSE